MKKFLTLTAVGAILSTPASAVQKCARLPGGQDTPYVEVYDAMDWHLTYDWGLTLYGTSAYITDELDYYTPFSMEDEPNIINLEDMSQNTYCACRLVYPVQSSYVVAGRRYSLSCGQMCNTIMTQQDGSGEEFRDAIFGTIKGY